MPKASEKQALVAFENAVQYAKYRQSKWHRLARLYVLFMDQYHNSKTTNVFISWLQDEYNEWDLEDLSTWLSFLTVVNAKRFIEFWVAKEDRETFINFIKEKDEKLWKAITEL